MKKIVLIALLIATNAFSYSENPIQRAEKEIGNCDNFIGNYQQLKACNEDNFKIWDHFLNNEYTLLIKDEYLSKEFKTNLKSTQLAWIKYRDLSTKTVNSYFASHDGSIFRNELAGISDFEIIRVTKNRALELCALRFSTYLGSSDHFECEID